MLRSASANCGPAARIVTKRQHFSCKVSASTKVMLMTNAWKTMIYLQGVIAGLERSGLPLGERPAVAENVGHVLPLHFGEDAGDLAKLGIAAGNVDAEPGNIGFETRERL